MTSKEDLVQSLIIKQSQQSNQNETTTQSLVEQEAKGEIEEELEPAKIDTGQEYVYWARRGENEQLETAGEVEVCSSGVEQENVNPQDCQEIIIIQDTSANRAQTSSTQDSNNLVYGLQVAAEQIAAAHQMQQGSDISDGFPQITEEIIEQQQRLEAKREAAKLQEKLMNEEYQKAIGYLLCSSKSKSGKQKKKQTMTAYLFFCRRYRAKIVARNPKLSFAQISKVLSHMWRNASEQEKNTYRLKLEHHRTKVNAIVEKNMIEKMKMVKQQKLMEEVQRQNGDDHDHNLIASSSLELHDYEVVQQQDQEQQTAIENLNDEEAAAVAKIQQPIIHYQSDEEEESVEENISHAVIDPQTKRMLLEAES